MRFIAAVLCLVVLAFSQSVRAEGIEVVSSANPDPNFGPSGKNESYTWKLVNGVPTEITMIGTGFKMNYIGFIKQSGKSYLERADRPHAYQSYAPNETITGHWGGVHLPAHIVRNPAIANDTSLFGYTANSSAVAPSSGAAPAGTLKGTITHGSTWTVSFINEQGKQETDLLLRPDISANGIDFTPAVWDELNEHQAGKGMWIVRNISGFGENLREWRRIVNVKVDGGKVADVDVSQAMTPDQLGAALSAQGISYRSH